MVGIISEVLIYSVKDMYYAKLHIERDSNGGPFSAWVFA